MIELAPPEPGLNCAGGKKNQVKNIKRIVKDCILEIPQVDFLRVNIKINKLSAAQKIIRRTDNQKKFAKKIDVILHIAVGYGNIVPVKAKAIQEKIVNTLKTMTNYENINVDIYVKNKKTI